MKRWGRVNSIAVFALLLSGNVVAATVYVIDQLSIGLHNEPQTSSPISELVTSGAPLEVLERDGAFVRVRSSDGVEGWVDKAYVSDAQPVASRYEALTSTVEALRAELGTLRSEIERMKSDLLDSEDNRKRQIASITRTMKADIAAKAAQIAALRKAAVAASSPTSAPTDGGKNQQLRAEIELLTAELADVRRTGPANTNAPIPSDALREMQHMAEENRGLKGQLTASRAAMRDLRSRVAEQALTAPDPPAPSDSLLSIIRTLSPYDLALLVFSALFLFGFGALLHDYSIRRRHGGFRL
jgi:SH3 domain protein